MQLKRVKEAMFYLEKMLRIQPQNASIYFNLGELANRLNMKERAKRYYELTIKYAAFNPKFNNFARQAEGKLRQLEQ